MSTGQRLTPDWYWIRPAGCPRSEARPAYWSGDLWRVGNGELRIATGYVAEVIGPCPHPDDRPTRAEALAQAEAALAAWYGDGPRPARGLDSLLVSLAREAGWLVVKE